MSDIRTKRLKEFDLDFQLDELDIEEREKIIEYVNKIPFTLQATDDLKLQVVAKDSPTYFYKTNKIVDITPKVGGIEAIYHGNPIFVPSDWLNYKFLWSTPDEVIIACNDFDREFRISYSK